MNMPKSTHKKSKQPDPEPARIVPEKTKKHSLCEPDWKKERDHFDDKLKNLSSELKNQKKLNNDLAKRIVALENSIKHEKKSSANSTEDRRQTIIDKIVPSEVKGIKRTIIHQKQKSSHDIQEKRTIYQSLRRALKTNASCSIGGSYHRAISSLGAAENSIGKEFKNIDLSAYEKQKKTMNQLNSMAKKIKEKIMTEEETGKQNEQNQSLYSIAEDVSSSDCSKSNTTIIHLGSKSSTPSEEAGLKHNTSNATAVKQPIKETESAKKTKVSFQPKCILKSHLDCCRDLIFTTENNYLASVSEDCLLKIWKVDSILNSEFAIEPYFSFRGHTGPLFTISTSHYRKGNTDAELLYTAGLEGVIRVWGIPNYEIDPYSKTNGKNYCIGVWASHKDVIWQLVHHPTDVQN